MPEIVSLELDPMAVKVGDHVDDATSADVLGGKTVYPHGHMVTSTKTGQANTVLETTGGKIVIRNTGIVIVRREQPTEAETAARKAMTSLAHLTHEFQQALKARDSHEVRLAEALVKADSASRAVEVAASYLKDEAQHELWSTVEALLAPSRATDDGAPYTTLVGAIVAVADNTVRKLAFGYSDDTWSGRFRNDIAREKADGQREWLRSYPVAAALNAVGRKSN